MILRRKIDMSTILEETPLMLDLHLNFFPNFGVTSLAQYGR